MTTKLELSLLGTVAITQNGERVSEHVSAKSQALLYYLALTGRPHSRKKEDLHCSQGGGYHCGPVKCTLG